MVSRFPLALQRVNFPMGRVLTLPFTPPSSSASRAAASQSSSFLERWPFGIIQRPLPRHVTRSISRCPFFLRRTGSAPTRFCMEPETHSGASSSADHVMNNRASGPWNSHSTLAAHGPDQSPLANQLRAVCTQQGVARPALRTCHFTCGAPSRMRLARTRSGGTGWLFPRLQKSLRGVPLC
jgi:hypothetical protein